MVTATKTKKTASKQELQIFKAHYSEFTRNEENLRDDVEREALLEKIKADGGVKIPALVYEETESKDLKVLFDGNSRHWVLEQLAKDEEYLAKGGSLDLPYMLVPASATKNPIEEIMFMISLGTSSKNLSPLEESKGYLKAIEKTIDLEIEKREDWDSLSSDEQERFKKQFKTKAINQIIKRTGKTKVSVYSNLRVFEYLKDHSELKQYVEDRKMSISTVDELIKVSKKLELPPQDLLELAKKSAFDRNKEIISEFDLKIAQDVLKHKELSQYVVSGAVPTSLVDQVIHAAEETKSDLGTVVTDCVEFGGVTEENLKQFSRGFGDDNFVKADEAVGLDLDDNVAKKGDGDTAENKTPTEKVHKPISPEKIAELKSKVLSDYQAVSNLIESIAELEADEVQKLSRQLSSIVNWAKEKFELD